MLKWAFILNQHLQAFTSSKFSAPGQLAAEFPDKNIYFTECTGYGPDNQWGPTSLTWNQKHLFIGQPVFGQARSVLLWNIALDEDHGPNVAQNCGQGQACGCRQSCKFAYSSVSPIIPKIKQKCKFRQTFKIENKNRENFLENRTIENKKKIVVVKKFHCKKISL